MKGVDYEDDRRPELDPASAAAASRARALVRDVKGHEALPLRTPDELDRGKPTLGRDVDQLVLDDERAAAEEARKKQRRRHVARDRLAVDKDAPELVRKRKWIEDEDDDEAPDEERPRDPVLDLDAIGDLVGKGALLAERRAQLFAPDQRPEPGDPGLTDPDEIQRALETPVAYAKHAMILAEAFRRSTGATRAEAVNYLAKMFVAPTDRAFGRLAIKEFGPSTGILDIYPLEVVAEVLDRYPGFLPKAGLGRFVHNVPATKTQRFHTDTKTPIILEYPEELKIRGFAIVGGGRPGYTFEPDVAPGKYRLHIESPGKFEILVSAVNRAGHTLLDRIQVRVRAKKAADLAAVAEPAPETPRDAAKVGAWPVPKVRPIEADAEEAPSTPPQPGRKRAAALTTSERVRMTQLDAMRGPLPGRMTRMDDDAPLMSADVALPDEDAEILRAAVAAVLDQVGHLEVHAASRATGVKAERAARDDVDAIATADATDDLGVTTQPDATDDLGVITKADATDLDGIAKRAATDDVEAVARAALDADLDDDTQASVRVDATPSPAAPPRPRPAREASAAKAQGFAPRPVQFDDDDTGGDELDDELDDATDALDHAAVAAELRARAIAEGLPPPFAPGFTAEARAEATDTEIPVADAATASHTRDGDGTNEESTADATHPAVRAHAPLDLEATLDGATSDELDAFATRERGGEDDVDDAGDDVVVRPVDPAELEPRDVPAPPLPIAARTIDESDAIVAPFDLAADLLLPPPATAIVAPRPPSLPATPKPPPDDPVLTIEEVDDLEEIEDFDLLED